MILIAVPWMSESVRKTNGNLGLGTSYLTSISYLFEVKGRSGWRAHYVKEVDANEVTVRFYQEVYDGNGRLREIHHKYPVDVGHQQVTGEEP